MKEIITRVTRGGQVTLPAEVRKILGVKPQDKVAFAIEDNEIRLVSVKYTVASAAGSVKPPTPNKGLDQAIEEAKEEMAAAQVSKLRRQ
jgi:AbrB family looped-hinge helix DNA binding protein